MLESIRKRVRGFMFTVRRNSSLPRGHESKLERLMATGDLAGLRMFLADNYSGVQLTTHEERERKRKLVDAIEASDGTKLRRQRERERTEPIVCADCKVLEGERHQFGCVHGLCPNTRSDGSCNSPMRLLRRDELSHLAPTWSDPGPPKRKSTFYARLPSRCDECGAIHPAFPGVQ